MYFTAKAVNDKTHMFEALSDLVFSYIKVYHADSVWYYMSLLKDVGTLEESHPYLFFLRMRLFAGTATSLFLTLPANNLIRKKNKYG